MLRRKPSNASDKEPCHRKVSAHRSRPRTLPPKCPPSPPAGCGAGRMGRCGLGGWGGRGAEPLGAGGWQCQQPGPATEATVAVLARSLLAAALPHTLLWPRGARLQPSAPICSQPTGSSSRRAAASRPQGAAGSSSGSGMLKPPPSLCGCRQGDQRERWGHAPGAEPPPPRCSPRCGRPLPFPARAEDDGGAARAAGRAAPSKVSAVEAAQGCSPVTCVGCFLQQPCTGTAPARPRQAPAEGPLAATVCPRRARSRSGKHPAAGGKFG